MKQKALWINQIKGLCICLGGNLPLGDHLYPHLDGLQHPLSGLLAKCWVYFNLYLAPFRMPVFFFISGYLIRRYIDEVNWRTSLDKRIWSIVWVLALWGVLQWQALTHLNASARPRARTGDSIQCGLRRFRFRVCTGNAHGQHQPVVFVRVSGLLYAL
ncbi:acyltransferase family protein [Enterobacter hormaechei]|uniref:Acyltransferase family protein n=1 Tax=Enterobacter hormaechei TaxID=158836 RepID=A0A927DGK9_9ENTR|nr:acyltransferase family protein [Enterobacter hormaechei]